MQTGGVGCINTNIHTHFLNLGPSPETTCNNYQVFG